MDKFPRLNLPVSPPEVMLTGRGMEVFDPLRRRRVMLTPEEWVRQHFVRYLVEHLGCPPGRLGNEVGIRLNRTVRRCDTVVYAADASPLAIVEYKAPAVALGRGVFDQVARYNMSLRVPWLMVSNGKAHYACRVALGGYAFLDHLPTYAEMEAGW